MATKQSNRKRSEYSSLLPLLSMLDRFCFESLSRQLLCDSEHLLPLPSFLCTPVGKRQRIKLLGKVPKTP